MKTMKRHLFQSIQVICLIATFALAFSLASCNKEDIPGEDPEVQQPAANEITFTATLAPKGEGPLSKAITSGTDADDKEILNVAWAEGEEIAVYYQKTNDSWTTAIATIGTPNPDGSAPLTAKLTYAKGGEARFVYPATLANAWGGIYEEELLNQKGNLTGANGISTKFDAATGEGTITVSGLEASVSGTVTMTNRVCICKFHFDIVDDPSSPQVGYEHTFSPIIINDGNGHTYTITSDRTYEMSGTPRGFNRSDDVYVAMLPVSGKIVSFYNSSLGSSGYNNYLYVSGNTTLTAGKFYRNLSINMVKDDYTATRLTFKDLSEGIITASSGDIINQSNSEATANTITIDDGAIVRLHGVNIDATASAGITCSGDATINLEGANTVTTSAENYPAILAGGSGKTLTIQGSGSLTATGALNGAGIGGGKYSNCGNITINGGTITATSGGYAAGIGSGRGRINNDVLEGSCGTIIINGGIINATGGDGSAGIGSGVSSKYGSIVISDGISSITATPGIAAQAPIGKGYDDQGSGTVTVDGVANWSGAETTHLKWTASAAQNNGYDVTRWILTHK